MAGRIREEEGIGVRVEVAVEARRLVDLAEIAVLGEESSEFGIGLLGPTLPRCSRPGIPGGVFALAAALPCWKAQPGVDGP